jgi:hypothetical protein
MRKIVALIFALAVSSAALGQTASPAVTLTASPASGPSPLSTILSWSTAPTALSCMASGAWSGDHSPSGSTTVTLTASATYTLTCNWAGATTTPPVTVTWDAPTQNTNGTALTNLASFNVYMDTVSPPQKVVGNVLVGTNSYTISNPPVGTDYFAVTALNSAGVSSALSSVVSLAVTSSTGPAVSKSASVTVTVTAANVPESPASVAASQ